MTSIPNDLNDKTRRIYHLQITPGAAVRPNLKPCVCTVIWRNSTVRAKAEHNVAIARSAGADVCAGVLRQTGKFVPCCVHSVSTSFSFRARSPLVSVLLLLRLFWSIVPTNNERTSDHCYRGSFVVLCYMCSTQFPFLQCDVPILSGCGAPIEETRALFTSLPCKYGSVTTTEATVLPCTAENPSLKDQPNRACGCLRDDTRGLAPTAGLESVS